MRYRVGVLRSGVFLLVLLTPLLAEAFWPPSLLGGPVVGYTATSAANVTAGFAYGAGLDWTVRSQWALTLGVERSRHTMALNNGHLVVPAQLTQISWGGVYRIDLTPILPFIGVNGQTRWFKIDQFDAQRDLAACMSVGLLIPLGEHFFASGEARYGLYANSQLGQGRTYLFRFGARTGIL